MKLTYSLILAAASCGMAFGATTAYTTPVGYETLSLVAGFNYGGVRLQQSPVVAGTFETVTSTTLTDNDVDLGAALVDTTQYIIEITGGNGAITVVPGTAASLNSITVTDDLTMVGVTNGASYRIRPVSTLASIFGAADSAGLLKGFYGPGGADLVYLPNATDFDVYFYDDGEGSWAKITPEGYSLVTGGDVSIVYTDGVVISAQNPLDLVVTGEVKKDNTLMAMSTGFNYVGTVSPVGATLQSTFGLVPPPATSNSGLDRGFYGPGGADLIYLQNGLEFDIYFYDDGEASWCKLTSTGYDLIADPSLISLPSGAIIANENGGTNILFSVPASYGGL